MITKTVETSVQFLELRADGIVKFTTKPGAEISLEAARETIEALRDLTGGKPAPCLLDITHLKSISRAARLYYAGPETAKYERATAMLVTSSLISVICNFFMGINKPVTPTKLFTSEHEAIQWLQQHAG